MVGVPVGAALVEGAEEVDGCEVKACAELCSDSEGCPLELLRRLKFAPSAVSMVAIATNATKVIRENPSIVFMKSLVLLQSRECFLTLCEILKYSVEFPKIF